MAFTQQSNPSESCASTNVVVQCSAVEQIPAASLQNLVEFLSSKAEGVAGVDYLM